jgi:sugar phosphate isomerase/epimerase
MHPRLVVNGVALSHTPLDEAVNSLADAELARVGFQDLKLDEFGWDRAVDLLAGSGLEVVYLIHTTMFTLDRPDRWPTERERLTRTVETADALGARFVYSMTGPGGSLTFEAASSAFADALAPALREAQARNVSLAIENQNQLRFENSIIYNLSDLADIAELSGIDAVAEMYYTWREPQLDDTVRRLIPHLRLVQLSDYTLGTKTMPDRVVPGDGIIPLERIVAVFLEAGYSGPFDLELVGPRIVEEGIPALQRGARYVTEILQRLGA